MKTLKPHCPSKFVRRFTAALLLLCLPALAQQTLFDIQYKTRIEGIPITTDRSVVQLQDGTYEYRMRSSNFLARFEETSHFRIGANGMLQPLRNVSERKVFGISSKATTDFDWESGVAVYRRKDDVREIEISEGMLDRTLYQYQLERDMRSGQPDLSYDIVDKGRVRDFNFENLGVEMLDLDSQQVSAFKLRRVTDDSERETLVWLAADYDYEIVKIYHREEDDTEYVMTRIID